MFTTEPSGGVPCLLGCEESLLRNVVHSASLDSQRRFGLQVPIPVRTGTIGRSDHTLLRISVEDFGAYKKQKLAEGKKPSVAGVAVGRRAHRLCFAMIRDQTRYDPAHWAEAVAAGRSVMTQTRKRVDVTAT